MEQMDLLTKRDEIIEDLEKLRDLADEVLTKLRACPNLESLIDNDFKNTSPKRLVVQGSDLEVEVETHAWCELVAAVAAQLADWHRKKMLDAARNKTFGTSRKSYISTNFDEEAFSQPERITGNITVETRYHSGKAAEFIAEMLEYCGYDTRSAYIETDS
ncbi:MAG: hypothetical protein ABEN55_04100 [Bradymonadaceae bacterium]